MPPAVKRSVVNSTRTVEVNRMERLLRLWEGGMEVEGIPL